MAFPVKDAWHAVSRAIGGSGLTEHLRARRSRRSECGMCVHTVGEPQPAGIGQQATQRHAPALLRVTGEGCSGPHPESPGEPAARSFSCGERAF